MTTQTPTTTDLIDLFTIRLEAVGGHVHRVAGSIAAAGVIGTLAAGAVEPTAWISAEVADRAPDLVATLTAAGVTIRIPETPGEVRDQPLGVGIAEAAIAETGSVIMVEPAIPSRSVTLMTETLAIICAIESILPSLDEATSVLRAISADGAAYATFVTGPSRTADIERQLTVGVQGPGVFHVILVDRLT